MPAPDHLTVPAFEVVDLTGLTDNPPEQHALYQDTDPGGDYFDPPTTWGGIVEDPTHCAYCASWPALPCAVHRTPR